MKTRLHLHTGCLLGAWGTALCGYFAPWIGQHSAALAWNAYDLFDLLRLLPEIETDALRVNLQALRLPLVGLAVLLPLLFVSSTWFWRLMAAGIGVLLALTTLPPYPYILTAWRTPGWNIPFWWSLGAVGGIVLGLWLAPKLHVWRSWLMFAWLAWTGFPAVVTLYRLLPALSRLHATPVSPGWGFWLCAGGWLWLMLAFGSQSVRGFKICRFKRRC